MPASPEQTLRRLTLIVALQWTGATLGLPLLPLFLEHRGGTPSVIGVIQASFFIAGVATQYLMGHVADRFGRRRILITSLVVYGFASMTYLLPFHAPWFALTRAFQGASASAFEVAALSAVSALFPEARRGRAISRILAAQLFGVAIGPLIGVAVNVNALGWAFFVTGLISLGAALRSTHLDLGESDFTSGPLIRLRWNRQLVGALVAASASGMTVGVYEACWTLLMHAHHASTLQIRLSWTMFAVPWVALSRVGGWLADHANRRAIALIGLFNGAFFLALYPHIHSNVALVSLGSLEAVATSLSMPSVSSLLTQGAHDRELSRRQGLSSTASTASLALAAAFSGVLFTKNPALPFTLVAVTSATLASTTLWWWRNVHGRISA